MNCNFVFQFNLSYTLASVISFWEQTFFTGIGKTIEFVFLLSVAIPHSNCRDNGYESVFDESELRLKENCICIFLVGPCYERGGAKCQSPLHLPVKRIQTTCMLKPKAHPHLRDNSEQHESKGGNAYAFLFVVLLVLFGGTCPCHTRPLCDPLGHLAPQISTWVT